MGLAREIKQCAQSNEELKTDLYNLNGQIALEKQNLLLLKKDEDLLSKQLTDGQEAVNSLHQQEAFLNQVRETNNTGHLWRFYFKKFIANMEPNNENMEQLYKDMKNRYDTLINRYEQKPEYLQIIEAETTTRDLTKVIGEKRNELMKLDTEREY